MRTFVIISFLFVGLACNLATVTANSGHRHKHKHKTDEETAEKVAKETAEKVAKETAKEAAEDICPGQTHVRLELKTNERPMMLRWKLMDTCTGDELYERGNDWRTKYMAYSSLEEEDYCVPHSMYSFKFYELSRYHSNYDAEWEEKVYGKGHYKLFVNGEELAHVSSMNATWVKAQYKDPLTFGETCPPTTSPTDSPTRAPYHHEAFCPGESHFHLDLKTHSSPISIQWELIDTCKNTVVAKKGQSFFNRYYGSDRLYKEDYCLPPSTHVRYRYKIWITNGGALHNSRYDRYGPGRNKGYYILREGPTIVAEGGKGMNERKEGYLYVADEEHEFGTCNDGWTKPDDLGPGDISGGKCPTCVALTLVACVPCDMFYETSRNNGKPYPEVCRVEFCEKLYDAPVLDPIV